jgi:hypothetical protein
MAALGVGAVGTAERAMRKHSASDIPQCLIGREKFSSLITRRQCASGVHARQGFNDGLFKSKRKVNDVSQSTGMK